MRFPRGSAAAAALVVLWIGTAGCAVLDRPQIICRDVDEATCQRLAADLIEEAGREDADKRVVKLTINGSGGAYDMVFSDGTGKAVVGH